MKSGFEILIHWVTATGSPELPPLRSSTISGIASPSPSPSGTFGLVSHSFHDFLGLFIYLHLDYCSFFKYIEI